MNHFKEFQRILEQGPWPQVDNAIQYLFEHRNEMSREEFQECIEEYGAEQRGYALRMG